MIDNEKTPLNRPPSTSNGESQSYGAPYGDADEPSKEREGRSESQQTLAASLVGSVVGSVQGSIREAVDAAFALPGRCVHMNEFGGKATVASEISTVSKNLIGAGVLSLSGGIALSSDAPAAVVPAALWLIVLAFVFGYYCLLIGKLCDYTGQITYRELWQETVGDRGRFLVPTVNAAKAGLGCLAMSSILSQTGVSLCKSAGWEVSHIESLFFITIVLLLPLCLLKNLNALAPMAVLGTLGILVTAVAMTIRFLDGSYQPGGLFHKDLDSEYMPKFGDHNGAWGFNIFPFLCMSFEAYVMHYNSARYYVELKDSSLPRFGAVVGGSFGLSAIIYIVISAVGFLTFGANTSSYVLNNYSASDPLATLCRIMVAFSTLLTYPITFVGFRDGILELLDLAYDKHTEPNVNMLTVILLTILTVTAIFVRDLGFINSVGGGSLATVMVFVFPTVMYISLVNDRQLSEEKREVRFAAALMTVFTILGFIGVYLSVLQYV